MLARTLTRRWLLSPEMQPADLRWALSMKHTPELEDLEKYITNLKNFYIHFN